MQAVDKFVEVFLEHKGKRLLDIRGSTPVIVTAGQVDKAVTFTLDFENDATGAIDSVIVEATAQLEDAGSPNGMPTFEAADLRIVSVRNYTAPKPTEPDPVADEERRLRSLARTGQEPGANPSPPAPPSAKDMDDMERLRSALAGNDEPDPKPEQPPEPEPEQ